MIPRRKPSDFNTNYRTLGPPNPGGYEISMRFDRHGITRREQRDGRSVRATYTWGYVLETILIWLGLGRFLPPPF